MGKLINFQVVLDNHKDVYYSGDLLQGNVKLHLGESMKMKAVRLKIKGHAHVRWSETYSTGKSTVTVVYWNNETYFEHDVSLFGKDSCGDSEDKELIEAGQHSYPFRFTLPPNLPSSFEGKYGRIRYTIKATIDKPWKFNHNTKMAISVHDPIDLNSDAQNKVATCAENDKKIFLSGPVVGEVRLNKTGFVPGEFILIDADCKNGSSFNISKSYLKIIQKVKFISNAGKVRTCTKTMACLENEGAKKHKSLELRKQQLQIPSLPPTMLTQCKILKISYKVQFELETPKLSRNLRVKCPFFLGSIPLQGFPQVGMPPKGDPQHEDLNVGQMSLAENPPRYEAPPPQYASVVDNTVSIKEKEDNDYLMGEIEFAPKYAYYDWSQQAFDYSK